ncbi:multidrug transporter [Saxibacter everestensis]|uniref:Multidrug transporter n=1 Tax=Saxibacter everestensis TaxID=2909229 RepID=A0ABY8QWI7_9MICO|nr:multidrug transporter [Brevibacteriaceae bacterium ZFBP1038]
MTALAVVLALTSAVCLAFGAHFQHGAVQTQERTGSFKFKHLLELAKDRRWLLGLGVLGLGMLLNVVALSIAPVMVVQPMGTFSLIVAVLMGMTLRGLKFKRRVLAAVLVCTVGLGLFVTLSALNAHSPLLTGPEALPVTVLTLTVSAVFGLVALLRKKSGNLFYIIAAGVLFGCVAASVHLVGQQLLNGLDTVSWECFIGIIAAGLLGSWFVQTAYASGPPELVIAGLTVIDPIVAVIIGAIVLQEASKVSPVILTLMIVCGACAVGGVLVLSRYHPDVLESKSETTSIGPSTKSP